MVNVAFFGTPAFALPTLERLIASPHRVVVVVTQPDRPRGRGHRTSASPTKHTALGAGIPVLEPVRLRDPEFLEAISARQPDFGVVAAYGRILPEIVLQIPRHGMLNVHASLLPAYRGAAPVQRAIMAGAVETGVTIMRVVPRLDTGPILARAIRPVLSDETAVAVERDLADLGAGLLVQCLDDLVAGPVPAVPQDDRAATYAPRLVKMDGLIDWHAPGRAIHNLVRALHPWPHAFTFLGPTRYVILRTALVEVGAVAEPRPVPGQILESRHDRLVVAAGDRTALAVRDIQPEGRRPMTVGEFLAGHRIQAGAILQGLAPR